MSRNKIIRECSNYIDKYKDIYSKEMYRDKIITRRIFVGKYIYFLDHIQCVSSVNQATVGLMECKCVSSVFQLISPFLVFA